MTNFKEMTKQELKQYLSEHRKEEDKFSEALGELLSRRDPDAKIYSPNMSEEEVKQVIEAKVAQVNQNKY